jgi:hypothetical protein
MITLFDKKTGKGQKEFEKYAAFNIDYVDVIDGVIYSSSEYDLPSEFDEYALSLV